MVHKAERLPVTLTIGAIEHSYNVELGQYSRTTIPTLREQRDTSEEPGEQSIDNQFWLRSQTDWSFGAGQDFFDVSDSNRSRFSSSSGIDPWTKGQISLLPMCETKNDDLTLTNVIMKIFRKVSTGSDIMYVASGTTLYYSAAFASSSTNVNWSTVSAPASGAASTIKDITSDGTNVYISYGDARVPTKQTLGVTTAPTNFGSLNPDYIDVVSGRFFAIDGNNISEYDSAGAKVSSSMDSTLYDGEWLTVGAGPAGFYIASNVAGTGVINFVKIGNTDALLQEAQQVAELPRGEKINEMISYGGFLVFATSKGLRVATTEPTAGGVTYGPVMDDVGEVFSLVADERFVWFGGSSGKVYRADLSKFSETLVPAWAADLLSVGDGNSLGNVTHLARSNGKTYFVDAANGVQGPMSTDQLVAAGTMTVGDVKWNSQFDKILRTIEIRSAPSAVSSEYQTWGDADVEWADADEFWVGQSASVGGAVTVTVTNDENYSVTTGSLANKTPVNVDTLVPELSEAFKIQLNLTRDSTVTAGPQIESWKIQAFPAPTRVDEIVLPIILKTRVATSRGRGTAAAYDTKSEYDALRTAMTEKKVITYQEGSRSDTVVIDQMSMSAEKLSDDGDWWEGVCTLRLLTVP
tara:strand:- start:308 stop:2215 length:1908 start_codon:yes stop_codon:yes gene_type:complete